jgi:hypothetical protein
MSTERTTKPRFLGRLLRNRRAGDQKLTWNQPGLDAPETIVLGSDSFQDGARMPESSAGHGVGENISPRLAWRGAPDEATELALIIEDPDAPLPRPVVHLALAGISPDTDRFEEGELNEGARYGTGRATFGRTGYQGPRPVPGHGPHRYVFQLYALNKRLGLAPDAKPKAIAAAMKGNVIARGQLQGTYER